MLNAMVTRLPYIEWVFTLTEVSHHIVKADIRPRVSVVHFQLTPREITVPILLCGAKTWMLKQRLLMWGDQPPLMTKVLEQVSTTAHYFSAVIRTV